MRARVNRRLCGSGARHRGTAGACPRTSARPAWRRRTSGLQALAQRCRFGSGDGAARSDDGQLAKIRAPLFIFILAEELTRPFLPGYIKSLLVPIPGLPWLAPEDRRRPADRAVHADCGAGPALPRRVGAARRPPPRHGGGRRASRQWASSPAPSPVSVLDLLLWRSLCALGYGLVFVAAQGHVLEHMPPAANRAQAALPCSWARSWWPRCAGRRSAASWPTTSASAGRWAVAALLAAGLDRRDPAAAAPRTRTTRRHRRAAARPPSRPRDRLADAQQALHDGDRPGRDPGQGAAHRRLLLPGAAVRAVAGQHAVGGWAAS